MRGQDVTQSLMFSYRTLEERIPESHPLRKLRALLDEILSSMDDALVAAYLSVLVLALAQWKGLVSSDHFSVDGTLIEAGASMKRFVPRDGSGQPPEGDGRKPTVNCNGGKRPNDTHHSETAPDARTTRHAGYKVSIRKRKLVEKVFGWAKCVGQLRKAPVRGWEKIKALTLLNFAAYNLTRTATIFGWRLSSA